MDSEARGTPVARESVFTIGHGTRSAPDLMEALSSAGITKLIDVRRHPGSRRHPQFARDALEQSLPGQGIQYEWWGEALGGRRSSAETTRHPGWRNASFRAYADHMDTNEFRAALTDLEVIAGDEIAAIMCAETLWWKCHRRLIADALVLRGTRVTHIVSAEEHQEHKLHPAVRQDEDGWPVYDVGETAQLT